VLNDGEALLSGRLTARKKKKKRCSITYKRARKIVHPGKMWAIPNDT